MDELLKKAAEEITVEQILVDMIDTMPCKLPIRSLAYITEAMELYGNQKAQSERDRILGLLDGEIERLSKEYTESPLILTENFEYFNGILDGINTLTEFKKLIENGK